MTITPTLYIPPSQSTVVVKAIDSLTTLDINPTLFWKPYICGLDVLQAPVFTFLVSHGQRHVLFDLGVRKDWNEYAPKQRQLIETTTCIKTYSDVSEMLDGETSTSVKSRDIEAIILSHYHFDHIGDPSTFPSAVSLVVGPGFLDAYASTYPASENAMTLASDIAGREVKEINFVSGLKAAGFDADDFFGDGSLYLLNAPGHCNGHICALARTSTEPDTFVFLGADACHHVGLLRPSEHLPLPHTLSPNPLPQYSDTFLAETLLRIHPGRRRDQPFFQPLHLMFPEYENACETIGKIQALDADERVLVVLAHDAHLLGEMELFPNDLNGWREQDLKRRTRWAFCKDFQGVLELATK